MKKRFLLLLTMLSAVISTYADNTLTATGSIAKASGSKGTLSVSLTNDVAIKGVQFNLTLPDGVSVEDHSVTSRATGFSAEYDSSGMVTLSTTSLTAVIPAGEGDIINFTIKANSELTAGTAKGTLSGIVLSTSGTSSLTPADISYDLEITDGVVLDENSTALPVTQGPVNVTVKRTLKGGVWNTLCLPFDMTEDQSKTAFGDGVVVCQFNSMANNNSSFKLNFLKKSKVSMNGNTPYLIKPASDITEFNVNAVNIAPNEDAKKDVTVYDEEKDDNIRNATFYGTLRAGITIPADNIFLGAGDNKFYYSEGSTTIKAFRGYFWLKDFSSSAGARQLNLVVDGEDATGIEGLYINGEPVVKGVYNLKGQRVDTPTQKGIYIKDGKKVVIK